MRITDVVLPLGVLHAIVGPTKQTINEELGKMQLYAIDLRHMSIVLSVNVDNLDVDHLTKQTNQKCQTK